MNKKLILFAIILLLAIEIIPINTVSSEIKINNNTELYSYGFIIEVNERQPFDMQTNISILINKLLEEKITIYWICEDISIETTNIQKNDESNVKSFKKGCFVVPFTDDTDLDSKSAIIIYYHNVSKNIVVYYIKESMIRLRFFRGSY